MKEIPNLTQNDLDRFWSKVDRSKDCWEWKAYKNKEGYGTFSIKNIQYLSHRVSLKISKNVVFNGLLALHKCDNPSCVNPDHLFLGTDKDNMIDKTNKGRHGAHTNPRYKIHPSVASYDKRGCRCFDCKKLKSKQNKSDYLKRKYGITGQNASI